MTGGTVPGKPVLPSPEQLQQLADQMVRGQFQVIGEAARDCDLIVAAGALQIATRSIAEVQKIPYVFAAYCPAVLPSSKYPPPEMGGHYSFSLSEAENEQLWKENEQSFDRFGAVLNEERAKIGQGPVSSVQRYMFTDRPWLAADPALAPAFPLSGMQVVQTGAWMVSDQTALPDELEEFLVEGAPPVYLGFGSMQSLRADRSCADRVGPGSGAAVDPFAGMGRSHPSRYRRRLSLDWQRQPRKAVPAGSRDRPSRRCRDHGYGGTGGQSAGHYPAQFRSVLLGTPSARVGSGSIRTPTG